MKPTKYYLKGGQGGGELRENNRGAKFEFDHTLYACTKISQ
jgi:hypothetical protein